MLSIGCSRWNSQLITRSFSHSVLMGSADKICRYHARDAILDSTLHSTLYMYPVSPTPAHYAIATFMHSLPGQYIPFRRLYTCLPRPTGHKTLNDDDQH